MRESLFQLDVLDVLDVDRKIMGVLRFPPVQRAAFYGDPADTVKFPRETARSAALRALERDREVMSRPAAPDRYSAIFERFSRLARR